MSNLRPMLLLELALAAICVAVLAKSIVPFLSKKQVLIPDSRVENQFVSTNNTASIDTSILSKFDPFHRDPKPPEPSPEIIHLASETTLELDVFGIRADIGGDTSSAIIGTPDNEQSIYFIGDEIIPSVTLERVDIDFVILDKNGVKERLSRQGKAEKDKDMRQTIKAFALAFKAQDMIDDLRFYPHREGQVVTGYRMRSRNGQSIEKYGFKQNDLITAINGESLAQNLVNLPILWKNLKQASYASIQIIRDDVPMTIKVNLR